MATTKAAHLKVISRTGVPRVEPDVDGSVPRLVSENKIPASLREGDVVGRHRILKRIGRGSIGDVYLCEDIDLPDLRVALKVLAPHRVVTPELKQRFKNEIAASARVNHRNVIRPYEFIQKRDLLAYTMEYINGGDLSQWMHGHKEFRLKEAIGILLQICTGVQAIHEAGIIHRDLKPQNILISERQEVRISDFAVSRTSDFERVTLRGRLVGTIDYLSPQYLEHGEVTTSCDIYAIGAIAFEMLTHRAPLTGGSLYETLALKLSREAPPVHEVNPSCPLMLSAIVSRALRRSPEERYGSAKEMVVDLLRLMEAEGQPEMVRVEMIGPSSVPGESISHVGEEILGRSLSALYPLVPVEPSPKSMKVEAPAAEFEKNKGFSLSGFTGGFVFAALVTGVLSMSSTPLFKSTITEPQHLTSSSTQQKRPEKQRLDFLDEVLRSISASTDEEIVHPVAAKSGKILEAAHPSTKAAAVPVEVSETPNPGQIQIFDAKRKVSDVTAPADRRVSRRLPVRSRRNQILKTSNLHRQKVTELQNIVSASTLAPRVQSENVSGQLPSAPESAPRTVGSVIYSAGRSGGDDVVVFQEEAGEERSGRAKRIKVFARPR